MKSLEKRILFRLRDLLCRHHPCYVTGPQIMFPGIEDLRVTVIEDRDSLHVIIVSMITTTGQLTAEQYGLDEYDRLLDYIYGCKLLGKVKA